MPDESVTGMDQLRRLTIDYETSSGARFVVTFGRVKATYWGLDDFGQIFDRNDSVPYHAREIRPGLVFVVLHEPSVGDIFCLTIDLDEDTVHTAALTGFPKDDRGIRFEDGNITKIINQPEDTQVHRDSLHP